MVVITAINNVDRNHPREIQKREFGFIAPSVCALLLLISLVPLPFFLFQHLLNIYFAIS